MRLQIETEIDTGKHSDVRQVRETRRTIESYSLLTNKTEGVIPTVAFGRRHNDSPDRINCRDHEDNRKLQNEEQHQLLCRDGRFLICCLNSYELTTVFTILCHVFCERVLGWRLTETYADLL